MKNEFEKVLLLDTDVKMKSSCTDDYSDGNADDGFGNPTGPSCPDD